MRKYLVFVMLLCVGISANAQMATTLKTGKNDAQLASAERLVSADHRNICFRTTAQRINADLNPSTHCQDDTKELYYGMPVKESDGFSGYTEYLGDVEVILNTLTYLQYDSNNDVWNSITPGWNVGSSTDTYYGNGNNIENLTRYVNLKDYEWLRIYRDDDTDFRAFFFNADETACNIIDKSSTCVTWNDVDKFFAVDLSQLKTNNGDVKLIAIKSAASGTNDIVNKITVCKRKTITRTANCSYSYDSSSGVGTFSFNNVRVGYARVNLFYGLKGNIDDYENFVIRTLSVSSPLERQTIAFNNNGEEIETASQTARYCIQFCDENHDVIHQASIYSEDMKVIQLKEFFTDEDFEKLDEVWITTGGGNTNLSATVQIAEAYFITPFDLNKSDGYYTKGEYFYDMDDAYIGNAYIHPSYFMMSNGVNFNDQTGVISIDPKVYSYTDLNLKDFNSGVSSEQNKIGEVINSGELIFGAESDNYVDLSEYDYMYVRFDQTKGKPTVVFNLDIDNNTSDVINSSNFSSNSSVVVLDDGWKINLGNLTAAHLTCIKSDDATGATTTLVNSVLLEKIQTRGTGAGEVDMQSVIKLSVPFSGFDMSDVTVVSMDNAEDGDIIGCWIAGYEDYYNQTPSLKNLTDKSNVDFYLAEANKNTYTIRQLYNSRYNGDFKPASTDGTYNNYVEHKSKVNNIYWLTKNDQTTSMTIYDICVTKNHVIARNGGNHTKLSLDLYHIGNANVNKEDCKEIGTESSDGYATLYGYGNTVYPENYADLTKFYKMQIKGTPGKQLRIVANLEQLNETENHEIYVRLDANGLANLDIAPIVKKDEHFRLNVIKTPYNPNGTTKIDYIKLFGEEDGIVELNDELFHTWIRNENITVTRRIGRYAGTDGDFSNQIGTGNTIAKGGTIFGPGAEFYKENYAELTGYKTIRVYGTVGMRIRIIYNCSKNKDESGVAIIEQMSGDIDSKGYVDFDISDFVYFHLNSIKNSQQGTGEITKVELISNERVDYVLEGNGTLSEDQSEANAVSDGGNNAIPNGTSAIEALNDVGARVIDARPRVSISRSSLTYPANPNCLILMRKNLSSWQSSRVQFDTPSKDDLYANMVEVGGMVNNENNDFKIGNEFYIKNLRIYDGYPFSAPRELTYESAKLTRKTVGGKIGTLILPFPSLYINGKAYETTNAEYANNENKGQGILEDVDINENDHVLLFQLHQGAVDAYMPYLYVADSDNDEAEFWSYGDNKTVAQTPETGTENAPEEYMTNERAEEETDRHYLRGFMESTHVENMYGYDTSGNLKRAAKATMNPFRVMIQAPRDVEQDYLQQAGDVKILLASFNDNNEPTEIKVVDAAELEGVVDVYTINGVLIKKNVNVMDAVNALPKGVYVVGDKKIVK